MVDSKPPISPAQYVLRHSYGGLALCADCSRVRPHFVLQVIVSRRESRVGETANYFISYVVWRRGRDLNNGVAGKGDSWQVTEGRA